MAWWTLTVAHKMQLFDLQQGVWWPNLTKSRASWFVQKTNYYTYRPQSTSGSPKLFAVYTTSDTQSCKLQQLSFNAVICFSDAGGRVKYCWLQFGDPFCSSLLITSNGCQTCLWCFSLVGRFSENVIRLRERFCAWQVRENVSQILEQAFFFCAGENTASATPPSHIRSSPHRGPDFLTAELPASKGMPLLFSQPLREASRERVADRAQACEVLFSYNPVGVVTPDWSSWRHGWWFWCQHAVPGTSCCLSAKPSTGKAASRGGGQEGSWAGDTTGAGREQVEGRMAEVAFRELRQSVYPDGDRKRHKKVFI